MGEMTPMMQHYLEIKKSNKDAILFYRIGDFFEMFFDDAVVASKLLGITLTGKDCGLENRAPMCGVPAHSVQGYIQKLISLGMKIAICDQTEDPALAKGLVKREVVRRITPGTTVDPQASGDTNNFIASVYSDGASIGLCIADISAGVLRGTVLPSSDDDRLVGELASYHPSEILFCEEARKSPKINRYVEELKPYVHVGKFGLSLDDCDGLVSAQTGKPSSEQGFKDMSEAVIAAGYLLSYLKETVMCPMEHMTEFIAYRQSRCMELPWTTRYSLELTETMVHKSRSGSLLSVIDKTHSAVGARTLRSWLDHPYYSLPEILRRQNAVEELCDGAVVRMELSAQLDGMLDLERLMGQLSYGTGNARTLLSLASCANRFPEIKRLLGGAKSELLRSICSAIDPLDALRDKINRAIRPEPPISVKDGQMINEGYNEELDRERYILGNSRSLITQLEAKEQERLGIKTLKIGYNRVFGYYLEVPKASAEQIPSEYIRRQTVSARERYTSDELKALESDILQAEDKALSLEYDIFCSLRDDVRASASAIMRSAVASGELDALISLAQTASDNNYVRPTVNLSGEIIIRDGRHPVVERGGKDIFVPNDTTLDTDENRMAVITGPNMAGKSTYMRQVALIVILAQIGSFVPASFAQLGLVDKIFTRIGASDELSAGKSTFMVEMSETAQMLSEATPASLLILDEIGRGTSTFDGMAIATAILEYIASKRNLGAKTLFATHYHELIALEGRVDGVKNYSITAKKRGDELIFLRKIVQGGADDSYGIEVAKLAGVPRAVVTRAKAVLAELESGRREDASAKSEPAASVTQLQPDLQEQSRLDLLSRLASLQVDTMTPLEALNALYKLSLEAKDIER